MDGPVGFGGLVGPEAHVAELLPVELFAVAIKHGGGTFAGVAEGEVAGVSAGVFGVVVVGVLPLSACGGVEVWGFDGVPSFDDAVAADEGAGDASRGCEGEEGGWASWLVHAGDVEVAEVSFSGWAHGDGVA